MENTATLSIQRSTHKAPRFVRWFRSEWGQIIIFLCILLLAILVLAPLYFLLIKSVKTPSEDVSAPFSWPKVWNWENYSLAWEYIKDSYLNSIIITSMTAVGIVVIGSMAAYVFAFFNFPLKKALFVGLLGLIMIPGILTLLPKYNLIVKLNLINNFWGVILPGIAGSLPYSVFLFTTFFKQIPKDMLEAAKVDGASSFQIFLRFILPLSRPILATVLIQSFISEWSDFLWARLVLTDESLWTLPVTLVSLTSYLGSTVSYGIPFAGYVLSSLPLLIIFIFGSKQLIAGLTSGSVKM
jgi:ABC-type glycerol-3-phosphate transport system permease component